MTQDTKAQRLDLPVCMCVCCGLCLSVCVCVKSCILNADSGNASNSVGCRCCQRGVGPTFAQLMQFPEATTLATACCAIIQAETEVPTSKPHSALKFNKMAAIKRTTSKQLDLPPSLPIFGCFYARCSALLSSYNF